MHDIITHTIENGIQSLPGYLFNSHIESTEWIRMFVDAGRIVANYENGSNDEQDDVRRIVFSEETMISMAKYLYQSSPFDFANNLKLCLDKLINKSNLDEDNRKRCKEHFLRVGFITKRYEMENYIPINLVEQQFKIDLSEYKDEWGSTLDIPKLLVGKVGSKLGRNDEEKEKKIKMILNGSVMKKCTYMLIQNMGNDAEIITWFNEIKKAMN